MAFIQIINRFCANSGYDPATQRGVISALINSAAKEIYEFTDLPGCYRELTLSVSADAVMALPYYVGQLRAMRSHYTYAKVELREMAPRYSYQPYKEFWTNWRVLTKSPIQQSIFNAAVPLIFTKFNPEVAAVTLHIEGRTLYASRVTEDVVFEPGEVEVNAVNNYIEIYSITKDAVNAQDITLTSDDVVLAIIPNDTLSSLYTIVDVSKLPNLGDTGVANTRYVDVLYKQPLNTLLNDGDTFPCDGYDDCIAYKALEFEASEREDGADTALAWYRKCEQLMNQITTHTNGATQKEIMFAPNGYQNIYPGRYATGRRFRLGLGV